MPRDIFWSLLIAVYVAVCLFTGTVHPWRRWTSGRIQRSTEPVVFWASIALLTGWSLLFLFWGVMRMLK